MILHTTYFGSVDWYAQIVRSQEPVTIDGKERFVKQTERNHCLIATANGVQKLTVPVTLPSGGKTPICDVRISDHGNWRHLHWQALSSAYGMSPFFDYYADDIRPLFNPSTDSLFNFNMQIMHKMLSLMGVDKEIKVTDAYQGLDRMEGDVAPQSGNIASETWKEIIPEKVVIQPYYQTFQRRHGFLSGMSILDLLFNMGPEAILVLKGRR